MAEEALERRAPVGDLRLESGDEVGGEADREVDHGGGYRFCWG